MKLYEEILLLKHRSKGKWCIENVVSFYKPLIEAQKLQRHYFWANFTITKKDFPTEKTCTVNDRKRLGKLFGFGTLDDFNGFDKRWALRNCVLPELGKHILDCARRKIQKTLTSIPPTPKESGYP
jgi:DNA (cytosine-5)-methyltransferase 1